MEGELPGAYKILECDEIRMLPLTRVAAIHNDVNEVLLRKAAATGPGLASQRELFYEGPNTLRNLCKATRGIIPTIKWRTQEKSSVLGDIMETKKSKVGPRQKAQPPRNRVGAPWTAAVGMDVSSIQYGAITDMDGKIRGERSMAPVGSANPPQRRQTRASAVDLNSQATLGAHPSVSSSLTSAAGADSDTADPLGKAKDKERDGDVSVGGQSMNSMERRKKDVGALRGYLQLLDQYSLHHFIIYKGQAVTDTPEFESFQRLHASRWGSIMSTIGALERLLRKHQVPIAIIDGPKVAEVSVLELHHSNELISCVANIDHIEPLLNYKANNNSTTTVDRKVKRRTQSAVYVQSLMRGYLGRKAAQRLRSTQEATVTLQTACRTFVCIRTMRKRLRSKREEEVQRWEELEHKLQDYWKAIQGGAEHVVIQLPSLSIEEHLRLSIPDLAQRQNLQLSRMFQCVHNRNVTVVYISPVLLPDELMDYQRKLLERLGIPARRLQILVPENADRFPRHLPLASLVYYSPYCLRRLRSLIKGRPAYIVPGVPHWQDRKLAELLSVPLLAPSPAVLQEYTAKSCLKRCFAEAKVNVPLGAHDIYNDDTLLLSLTKLIAGNLSVERWFLKLDVDYECMSWAYVDVGPMEAVTALRKEKEKLQHINPSNPNVWHHHDVQLIARSKIIKEIKSYLEKHLVICSPEVYPTVASFLAYLSRYGAVIEAEPKHIRGYPAVSLFIDPFGEVSVRATFDLIVEPARYRRLASMSPATCVPVKALEGAAISIGKKLFERKVIGHVSVTFLVFQDMARRQLRMWALDTSVGMSTYAASHDFFLLVRHSMSATHRRTIEEEQAGAPGDGLSEDGTRNSSLRSSPTITATHWASIETVGHPNFNDVTLPTFFKACRMDRMAYNLDSHRGLLFLLTDRLGSAGVGVLGMGLGASEAVAHVLAGLDFIKRQLGAKTLGATEEGRHFLKTLSVMQRYRERALEAESVNPAGERRH